MKIYKGDIAVLGIILLSILISICAYPHMPEKMASHWNAQGQVDGYMPKSVALFLMPIILTVIALPLLALPRIASLKEKIQAFRKYYDGFVIISLAFMLSVHVFMILWNLEIKIGPTIFLPIGVGIIFFFTGILCEKTKRNWFIGIRTPWALRSDIVWEKTNKLGGKLFKIAGVIVCLGVLFQKYIILFIIIPVLLIGIYVTIYSYIIYRKENK